MNGRTRIVPRRDAVVDGMGKPSTPNAAMPRITDPVIRDQFARARSRHLDRGRPHTAPSDEALCDLRVATCRAWFRARSHEVLQAMDDLLVEFALRGLEPPYAVVSAELAELRAEAVAMGPDGRALHQLARCLLDGSGGPERRCATG